MAMPYEDDEIEQDIETTEAAPFPIEGNDVAFDFEAGDIVLTGGEPDKVWDLEAVKQWINKVLLTRMNIYEIYAIVPESDDEEVYDEDIEYEEEEPERPYGTKVFDIIFSDDGYDLKLAEIQKDIEETLMQHPDIVSVDSFDFAQEGRELVVSFEVETTWGTESEEVRL